MVQRRIPGIPVPDELPAPKLYIDYGAWEKIRLYVERSAVYEINGFGYLTYDGVDFFVDAHEDIFITNQVVSTVTADVSGGEFAKALYKAVLDEKTSELRLQWHSHVTAGAYFSPVDVGTINSYQKSGMEWFVSLVTNRQGDISARVDVYRPIRLATKLSVVVTYSGPIPELLDEVNQDINTHVTVSRPERWRYVRP